MQTVYFFNMGTTSAVVQPIGMVPCFGEAWKNNVNVGFSSSAIIADEQLLFE